MTDKRVHVWVQRFADRPNLMLQWLDPETGRRKSKSAGTNDEAEASQARADLEYELNHGRHKAASRLSWEAFREAFEAEFLPPRRRGTQVIYRATLDRFEQICNPRTLRGITERTVSLFAAGLRKEPGRGRAAAGMMESTVKVRLQFLHTCLAWAVNQGMLPGVPRFPAVKVPRKRPQPVPTETFERLQALADDQTRILLLCGWLAGLRLNEAFGLSWEATDAAAWIDFGRDRIILPAELVKGVEDQWVPLDPQLREALEQLPRGEGRVFHFANCRGEPLTAGGFSQRVVEMAKRAGVRLSFKSLRRGFGCRYAGKVPAQVLQKLMRHANIKTTMDYYANVDDAVEAAVLGDQRNRLRNSGGRTGGNDNDRRDASRSQDNGNKPGGR